MRMLGLFWTDALVSWPFSLFQMFITLNYSKKLPKYIIYCQTEEKHVYANKEAGTMFVQAFFSVLAVMFLFGAISFLCVNLSNSLSVGIGIGIVVWMVLTSTMASNIPAFLLLENQKVYRVRTTLTRKKNEGERICVLEKRKTQI